MLRKVLSFVLLMSLAFAGVSCSNSDDSSDGGNGAGNGSGGGGASSSYAGWWYYNDGYLTRNLVLLSEDGSVLRAGTLDSSSGKDGVEFSGDELSTAKVNCSYKNESARAYLKKFADSGLSRLSYWCTVDSTQPFTWEIECIKKLFEDYYNGCTVEQKPDGSYYIYATISEIRSFDLQIDDTLRGYRGSYATVKPEVEYISTTVDAYYRDTIIWLNTANRWSTDVDDISRIYPPYWKKYNLDTFLVGRLRNPNYYMCIDGKRLGEGTAILKLTFSHPKATKDLVIWFEFKGATSSQQ